MGIWSWLVVAVAAFFIVRDAWRTYLAASFAKKQGLRTYSFLMTEIPGPGPVLVYVPRGPALVNFQSMQLVVKTSLLGVLPGPTPEEVKAASNEFEPSADTTCIYVTTVRRLDGAHWQVRSNFTGTWVQFPDQIVPAL